MMSMAEEVALTCNSSTLHLIQLYELPTRTINDVKTRCIIYEQQMDMHLNHHQHHYVAHFKIIFTFHLHTHAYTHKIGVSIEEHHAKKRYGSSMRDNRIESADLIKSELTNNINTLKLTSFRYKYQGSTSSYSNRAMYKQYMAQFGLKKRKAGFREIREGPGKTNNFIPNIFPTLHFQIPFFCEIEPALVSDTTSLYNDLLQNVNTCKLFSELNQDANKNLFSKSQQSPTSSESKLSRPKAAEDIHLTMMRFLDLSSIITQNYFGKEICSNINKKFILYLEGRYRALKFFSQVNESENLADDVCKSVQDLIQSQQNSLPTISQQQQRISVSSAGAGSSYTTCEKSGESDVSPKSALHKRKRKHSLIEEDTDCAKDDNQILQNSDLHERLNNRPYKKNCNKKKLELNNDQFGAVGKFLNTSPSERKKKNNNNNNNNAAYYQTNVGTAQVSQMSSTCDQFANTQIQTTTTSGQVKGETLPCYKLSTFSQMVQMESHSDHEDNQKLDNPLNFKDKFDLEFPDSSQAKQLQKGESKEKRKQIFHNLSKYLMHLILEMLSDDHIDSFKIVPGYNDAIKKVIYLLRQSGKRNQLSQTYYFNHSHYNCIFLTFTTENIKKLIIQPEFMSIHQSVFGNIDFNNEKEILNLNIIKSIVGTLVNRQLDYVISQIDAKMDTSLFELTNISTDCQAKVNYLKSVSEGIKRLRLGNQLIRF